jgi:glyoxylase-like metal-dependent hydrolase (beta-lactamase superfamily II)
MADAPIGRVITSGTFNLDGGSWAVDNNVWLLGDDHEVLVIDAAHDAAAIAAAVAGRDVIGIVCTHGHDDHVGAAPDLSAQLGATIWLHPDDEMLWDQRHPTVRPGASLEDGQRFRVGGLDVEVLHTPGHSPGSSCLYVPELGAVFTGDTLFQGGPGATGRSFSDADLIVASIRARLLALPAETVVHTGHGDSTTIGAEAVALAG